MQHETLTNYVSDLGTGRSPVLRSTRSDNSFETARYLGFVRASDPGFSFRVSNQLTARDRVDFFRFDLEPGVSMVSLPVLSSDVIKGGKLRVTSFVRSNGQTLGSYSLGRIDQVDLDVFGLGDFSGLPLANSTDSVVEYYLKIDKPLFFKGRRRKINYTFRGAYGSI